MVNKAVKAKGVFRKHPAVQENVGTPSVQPILPVTLTHNNLLKQKGIIQSISRKGNCWDNAMAENFFRHYKIGCVSLFQKRLHSVEDVQEITDTYIEYYNNKCYKAKLENMAPIEYRL